MTLSPDVQVLHFAIWFVALMEFILALYILVLNARHTVNRHMAALVLLIAVNTFAIGGAVASTSGIVIRWATAAIAATAFPLMGAVFIITVVLLRPGWLRGRWRWLLWIAYALVLFPILQTVLDEVLGTSIWYAGVDMSTYTGGYVSQRQYIAPGWFSWALAIYGYLMNVLTFVPIVAALRDKNATLLTRRAARWLLGTQIVALLALGVMPLWVSSMFLSLFVTLLYTVVFVHVAFQQMVAERRVQRGRLQHRLTALLTVISAPVLVIGVLMVGYQAQQVIENSEVRRLGTIAGELEKGVEGWLHTNLAALQSLVWRPDMISMEPERQKPLLEMLETVYPSVYLASTTGPDGVNVARSDDVAAKDYSDRRWFQEVRDGAPVSLDVVIGRTSGAPALVVAVPIRNGTDALVGVGMFASTLDEIANQVHVGQVGETGVAYVVDAQGKVVAHPDSKVTQDLRDFSAAPPVVALREGTRGLYKFVDASGVRWWAYVTALDYDWGLVVQQQEAEILASRARFQQIFTGVMIVGTVLMLSLGYVTIRYALSPIASLTRTAAAIAEGDLTRVAPVESDDEIGTLARTFNSVTAQLNELISNLEQRVEDRTQEVERRAEYLAVTAGVSRVAASILDLDELLDRIVALISERFDFYHTGIFLLDERREWAVLRAASSEGGKRMLARGHRLQVGEQGIVGYVSGYGRPRVALDVDEDVVWVKNPDLPETRSEMALPLVVAQEIIGVLDVQSKAAAAFSTEDVSTLRILADQVAVAIQNARLFRERRRAFEELQRLYGTEVRQGWRQRVAEVRGYRYTPTEVEPVSEIVPSASVEDTQIIENNTLLVPLRFGEEMTYGTLRLQRDPAHPWSSQEIEFVSAAVQDIAQALEVARLLAEARSRAARDRTVSAVGARLRTSLDPDAIMRVTVQELGRVLGAQYASIAVTEPQSEEG